MFVGYVEAMNDAHWYPGKETEDDGDGLLHIRVSNALKRKLEVMSAAETLMFQAASAKKKKAGTITINKIVDGALARFVAGYEAEFGPLPVVKDEGEAGKSGLREVAAVKAYAE